jgi:hypothetical protein
MKVGQTLWQPHTSMQFKFDGVLNDVSQEEVYEVSREEGQPAAGGGNSSKGSGYIAGALLSQCHVGQLPLYCQVLSCQVARSWRAASGLLVV